jgi:hypothetical protein
MFLVFNNNSAYLYMASSLSSPLNALKHHKMKRQLSWVYPFLGLIRSMLGDLLDLPRSPITKASPVSSQWPVHRERTHSFVRSNSNPLIRERARA